MLLSALIAATTLAQTPVPPMRVAIHDIDFNRREDVTRFLQRTRAASRAYCARHVEVVTPDRLATRGVCEKGMTGLAFDALPDHARESLIRSGQSRRFK